MGAIESYLVRNELQREDEIFLYLGGFIEDWLRSLCLNDLFKNRSLKN